MKHLINKALLIFSMIAVGYNGFGQTTISNKPPREDDYYKILTIPSPEDINIEVGGITTLPDNRIALCTRRGDIWIVENPYLEGNVAPYFKLFASGLHEPLGLVYRDNAFYAAQRGELTKLKDTDGDGKADVYQTIYAWPVSGHYHEYSYGPKFAPDGSMFVSGNVAFGDEEWWRGESKAPWRGWAMHIQEDGTMEPWATGFRSPCGLGMINGELFYADNQGDWVGSGGIWHVKKGGFMGHPAGLRWSEEPGSPVKLTSARFLSIVHDEREKKSGRYLKPQNNPDDKNPQLLYKVKKDIPELQLPSVWLPHSILGISNSEILVDETHGKFGPFAGQVFVGDQGQSKIMRISMEEVKGEYQGVAFDFVSGFQSGVLRMTFGNDGSLFIGETNRGWGSAGTSTSGLQRLSWTGKTPMEMKTVRAMPDGFEIEFTKPVNKKEAEDLDTYNGRSVIYKYHSIYGSPTINDSALIIKGVRVSPDGMKVRIVVNNLRQYYLHHVTLNNLHAADGSSILHPDFYYTLNNIPDGEKLADTELSRKRSSSLTKNSKGGKLNPSVKKQTADATKPAQFGVLPDSQIKILLDKNACSACHQTARRQVGPAFTDISKRKYSNDKIVQLIASPQAKNWPGYSTEMPPMTQVPQDEALKIAAWINSLRADD